MRTRKSPILGLVLVALAAAALTSCGSHEGAVAENASVDSALRHQDATRTCCAGTVYRSRATGYYPAANSREGGYVDRKGKKLRTLQDFIDGRTNYVSVAMDVKAAPYGARICIPELNARYGEPIAFRVVDTGGAFRGKGMSRLDICTRSRADAHAKSLNRTFEIVVCDR